MRKFGNSFELLALQKENFFEGTDYMNVLYILGELGSFAEGFFEFFQNVLCLGGTELFFVEKSECIKLL